MNDSARLASHVEHVYVIPHFTTCYRRTDDRHPACNIIVDVPLVLLLQVREEGAHLQHGGYVRPAGMVFSREGQDVNQTVHCHLYTFHIMVDVLKKGTTFNCRYLPPGILRIYNIMRHRLLVQVKLGLAVVEDGAPSQATLFLYVTNGHSVKLFCDKLLEGSLEQEQSFLFFTPQNTEHPALRVHIIIINAPTSATGETPQCVWVRHLNICGGQTGRGRNG